MLSSVDFGRLLCVIIILGELETANNFQHFLLAIFCTITFFQTLYDTYFPRHNDCVPPCKYVHAKLTSIFFYFAFVLQ